MTQLRIAAKSLESRVRILFWILAIVLGSLQAWTSRMIVSDDVVNFLDMGDHIWRHEWSMAVNGIWNPLYGAILGTVNGLFHPTEYWQYPVVHLVLFFFFLSALWSFDFFLFELISWRQNTKEDEELFVPVWLWFCIGYTLFLYSSLQLTGLGYPTPDMLVATSFYLACGLLVRIRRNRGGWLVYGALGLTLGLGYLAKAIMFPASLICLAIVVFLGLRLRQTGRALVCLLLFLSVCGPFIAALSSAKGKFSYSEVGRFNYAIHVNHVPAQFWQGETRGSGQPTHAPRQIYPEPATFEFATPVQATYPAWYDASYWYDGLKTPIDPIRQVKTFGRLLVWELALFSGAGGSIGTSLFILFWMSGRKAQIPRDISTYGFILLPSLIVLGLYALIYIEPRYLAPFLTVAAISLFFAVRLKASAENRRLYAAVAFLIMLMFFSPTESFSHALVKDMNTAYHQLTADDPNSFQNVAKEMELRGLRPGDRIGSLECATYNTVQWAHLARVKIIAETYFWPTLPDTLNNDFWKADSDTQKKIIQAFRKTGARALVSQRMQPSSLAPGWTRVGNSNYSLYWLDSDANDAESGQLRPF